MNTLIYSLTNRFYFHVLMVLLVKWVLLDFLVWMGNSFLFYYNFIICFSLKGEPGLIIEVPGIEGPAGKLLINGKF